jgi:hypothetical protein
LFPPVEELEQADEKTGSDPFSKHLRFSCKLYRSLAEAAGYHLRELE